MWYTNGSNEMGLTFTSTAIIYCDNTAAITISKNPGSNSSRTKYIDIHHHFMHDHVCQGRISVKYVDISDNLADICTKGLAKGLHKRLTSKLMDGAH